MSEQTVSFRQGVNGYGGTVDTQLVQATPTTSHAETAILGVDRSTDVQVLLRFNDLFGTAGTQIPAGAEIVSASLTLFTTNTGNGAQLHRMLAGWSDSSTWSGLGNGVQTNGVEAVATADVATGFTNMGASSFDVTASLQAWAGGATNLGWVFISQGTNGWDFYSAQGTTPPQLQIVYRVAGPANTAPVATADAVVVDEDGSTTVAVLGNDTDADGHALTVTGVGAPAHGVALLNSDGTISYTPHANYHGADSFSYTISDGNGGTATSTVSVTVNPVNDAPVANADVAVVQTGQSVIVPVLLNDSDVDGDALSVSGITTGPAHGTVTVNADNTVTYTANAGYTGSDSFSYITSDGNGATAAATVNLTVKPAATSEQTVSFRQGVNGYSGTVDTQLVQATPTINHAETAILGVDRSTDVQVLLRFNDLFGPAGTQIPAGAEIVSASLTLFTTNTGNGAQLHRMLAGWSDSSTWSGLGNGVQVNGVEAVATADVATGFTNMGASSFDVTASLQAWAGGATNLGWVFISQGTNGWDFYSAQGTTPPQLQIVYRVAGPANTAPVATADAVVVDEDGSTTVAVLGNDTDADGHALTVTGVGAPAHGVALLNSDGTISYTPHANYHGADSFSYTISDGNGGTATSTVSVTVNPVNDAPVANADSAVVNQGSSVVIAVQGNDADVDGDALSVTGSTAPAHGSVVLNSDGTITYTPNADYHGADSFSYTISDGHGGTATGAVSVTVNPVTPNNTPPVADADMVAVDEDTPVVIAVLSNDTDGDGHTLTVTEVGTPAHGTAAVNLDGTITYTPDADYHGPDSFSYTISDGHGGTASAEVSVTVAPINDAPVASADLAEVQAGQSVIVPVLLNDSDIDGDSLSVSGIATGPAHGTVTVNADNTVTYTANAGYTGTDGFSYIISDGNGATAAAAVNLTVFAQDISAAYVATQLAGTNEARILEHTNSSKSFYFSGSWWAFLPNGANWMVHKFTGTPTNAGELGGWDIASSGIIAATNQRRADIAWDAATGKLYVLGFSLNVSHVTTLYQLDFNAGTENWQVSSSVALTPQKLVGSQWVGNSELTLALDHNGVPLITAIGAEGPNQGLHLAYPTSANLSTWSFTTIDPLTIGSGGTNGNSKVDIVLFSHEGVEKIGLIYSDDAVDGSAQWTFAWHDTAANPTGYASGWGSETVTDTVAVDNHMAAVSDGEFIYAVIKDDHNSIWLLKGQPGDWEAPQLIVEGGSVNPSRPTIVLDETNDQLYIFYQENTWGPYGAIYMKVADADNPVFNPEHLGQQIMTGTDGSSFIDPQRPTHNVGDFTDDQFLLFAKSTVHNQVWYNDIQLGTDYLVA